MTNLPMLNSILTFLMTIPTVGPDIVKVLDWILAGSVMVTPIVGVWRAAVALMQSLAKATGSAALTNLANTLSTDDTQVEGFLNGYLLPVISELSLISVPTVAVAAAPKLAAKK